MTAKHIKFCMRSAYDLGQKEHPQKVLRNLGITYTHATPQSISDQWWFWNCQNLPEPLPKYLKDLNVEDPTTMVGWGISEKEAQEIKEFK